MQPSMGTLNSPSSRVVKDLTPSRCWILRYINFGIGASSPNLFLNMVNLYLVKFEARWNLNEQTFYCFFFYFLYLKVNLDLEKTNQLGESSPNFIFAAVNLDPMWTDGESWPNDFVEKVNRGEVLRWVGSRCPLTRASVVPDKRTISNTDRGRLELATSHVVYIFLTTSLISMSSFPWGPV